MRTNVVYTLAIAFLLVTAGCAGIPVDDPPWESSMDTTTTTTQAPTLSVGEAKQRVIQAEKHRIDDILADTRNVSGTAGTYGSINLTVLNRSETDAYMRVEVPYTYRCDGGEPIDGVTTIAVYHVTIDNTSLVKVVQGIQADCS